MGISAKHLTSFFLTACLLTALLPAAAAAEGDSSKKPVLAGEVSPLMSLPKEYSHTRKECKQNPLSRDCVNRLEILRSQLEQLREFCRGENEDPRCEQLDPARSKKPPMIETLCLENPQDRKCVQRRARARLRVKHAQQFCRRRVDHPRCAAAGQVKAQKPTIEQICQVFPERARCQRLAEERKYSSVPEARVESF